MIERATTGHILAVIGHRVPVNSIKAKADLADNAVGTMASHHLPRKTRVPLSVLLFRILFAGLVLWSCTLAQKVDDSFTFDREGRGRTLIFDPRLSGSKFGSCASCHKPGFSWSERETSSGLMRGAGAGRRLGPLADPFQEGVVP